MSNQETTRPNRLIVTSAPHLHEDISVSSIMWQVNLALAPALIFSLYFFQLRAAVVVVAAILGAAFCEAFVQKFLLKAKVSLCDGSAVLTGLLLAFCLPAATPWWVAFIGGAVAIAFGKQAYGGLGQNIFNPALIGRAVLLASWPVYITTWLLPGKAVPAVGILPDGVTGATPLGVLKATMADPSLLNDLSEKGVGVVQYMFSEAQLGISWLDMILGNIPGSLGETSKVALLIGGLYLLKKGLISWHVPVTMMGTVFVGSLIVTGSHEIALFHLFSGGLFLGAFFMATDMVTSPLTNAGQLVFGFGCGLITLLIRLKGGYPEGVCYSILLMNAMVPLIDKFTVPKKFGLVMPAKSFAIVAKTRVFPPPVDHNPRAEAKA